MPVPKRKLSRSRIRKRSSNKGIDPKPFVLCNNCQSPNMPHSVCEKCGFYKGVKVLKTKMDKVLEKAQRAAQTKKQESEEVTE